MKYAFVVVAIVTKVIISQKLFSSLMQIKFFFLGLVGITFHILKFWLDIKQGYNPHHGRLLHPVNTTKIGTIVHRIETDANNDEIL